jgi:hypothetical protein
MVSWLISLIRFENEVEGKMNEIFWVDGVQCNAEGAAASLAQVTLNALVEKTGVQPEWIDVVYWLGGDIVTGTLEEVGIESSAPVLSWPGLPLMDHFMLHSASRSLSTKEAGIVIMGQQIGDIAGAILLAGSDAVEKHGLTPKANLTARLVLSPAGSPLASIRQALENMQQNAPKALACIAPVDSDSLEILSEEIQAFNPAVRIEPAPSGVIMQLNLLSAALQEEEAGCGLLVSAIPHRPLLATLVQKA